MNKKETNNLIRIAHGDVSADGSVRNAAISRLWGIYGGWVMESALYLCRKIQPDFSLNGLSRERLLVALSSRVYEIFVNAVMKYDATQMASLKTYVRNEVEYRFKDDKRDNSERSAHEVAVKEMPERSGKDNNCGGKVGVEKAEKEPGDLTSVSSMNDNEYMLLWQEMYESVQNALEGYGELQEFLEKFLEVLQYCERGEVAEVAERLGISRATIYNYLKNVRTILKGKHLDQKFMLLLAA